MNRVLCLAALLLLLGCTSAPATVITPVPIVVTPEVEWVTIRQRRPDPVEAPKPVVDMVKLAEANIAAAIAAYRAETEAAQPTPAGVKESLTTDEPVGGPVRQVVMLSAAWCGPCRVLHDRYGGDKRVRFVDIDAEPAEAARLWDGYGVEGRVHRDGRPASIPAFVLVEGVEPIMRWYQTSRGSDVEAMLAYQVEPATVNDCLTVDPSAYVKVSAGRSLGSGVVVAPGLVLTAAHVVYGGWPHAIEVDGERYPAEVVGHDAATDLALVECGTLPAIEPVLLASFAPSNGSVVTSHGFPSGGRRLDRTSRITVGRSIGLYEVAGGFRQGESGGAVLSGGALVGIVTGTDGRVGLAVDHPSLVAFLGRYEVAQ